MKFAQLAVYIAAAVAVGDAFMPTKQTFLGKQDEQGQIRDKEQDRPSNTAIEDAFAFEIEQGLKELEFERGSSVHHELRGLFHDDEGWGPPFPRHGDDHDAPHFGPPHRREPPKDGEPPHHRPTPPNRPHFPFPPPGNPLPGDGHRLRPGPGGPGGKPGKPGWPGKPGKPGKGKKNKKGKKGKKHTKHPKHPKFPHHPLPGHGSHHPHHFNLTLYEILSKSNYTSKFFELVEKNKDLKKLLQDTSKNHTVLVPINRAFGSPPHWPHAPPHFAANQTDDIIEYHVLEGIHCAKELAGVRTLKSIVSEKDLGKGETQRLRFSTHFPNPHVHVNIVSTVIMTDFFGTNGVIHAVSHVLLPPPPALHLLGLFPNQFSTTLYAIAKLGLEDEINGLAGSGMTFFPPSNRAWKQLPWDVTTFLFSKHGVNHLRALIKYHVVPKTTLYSDSLVKPEPSKDDDEGAESSHFHTDLETLLEGKKISVDIKKWGGHFTKFTGYSWRLNSNKRVALQDILVKDGVLQIASGVLIPPCSKPPGMATQDCRENEEMTVEHLIQRLKV